MFSFRGGREGLLEKPVRLRDRRNERGGILVMTLSLVVVFIVIFVGLSGVITRTHHESVLQSHDELAFQIAESGLNYARWRLAHAPDDFSAETKTLTDQLAGDLGTYDINFIPPASGDTTVEIESIGRTNTLTTREVTLRARYGRPSLARYASITNGDVWYGGQINGAVHANGGIRMDGNSDGLMTSAQLSYACQPYHGCNSPFENKPGIWGVGQIQSLWDFDVPTINYNSLTLDLLNMQVEAQNEGTYYGPSGNFGYQIVFNSDDTYTISRVTSRGPSVWSYWDGSWSFTSHDVGNIALVETRAIPSNGVIFVEDTLWVSGDITDRVTVAAGVFPDTPSTNVDIILNGNITYGGVNDGSRAFAAIGQRHILIPWSGAPDVMQLDGAFVAQKGSFHRRYYSSCCGGAAHVLKTSLSRYGMIASNGVPATAWVDSNGTVVNGFQSGQASYDPNFLYGPPPYFPTDGQYEFISWEEEQ